MVNPSSEKETPEQRSVHKTLYSFAQQETYCRRTKNRTGEYLYEATAPENLVTVRLEPYSATQVMMHRSADATFHSYKCQQVIVVTVYRCQMPASTGAKTAHRT